MRDISEFIKEYTQRYPDGDLRFDEKMSAHTSFRIGGAAKYFFVPKSAEELAWILTGLKATEYPVLVIGNGSNLLVRDGKLAAKKSDKTVTFQDPYQLARDLGETEEARQIISAFADLHELHLNREETVWAGNPLMAHYTPETVKKVAARRIFNATSLGETAIVTACVGEYWALKSVAQDAVEILSIEDLILGE